MSMWQEMQLHSHTCKCNTVQLNTHTDRLITDEHAV